MEAKLKHNPVLLGSFSLLNSQLSQTTTTTFTREPTKEAGSSQVSRFFSAYKAIACSCGASKETKAAAALEHETQNCNTLRVRLPPLGSTSASASQPVALRRRCCGVAVAA